ncbi:MAG: flavodoxin family protein [Spirochaetes bacterium]|nr:flavodoxin family protein [Spirochaetota bacterium]MBN2769161.1 flavodoxin family protein [Spirochaetota bacterium]
MKVTAISASPRKDQMTHSVLKKILNKVQLLNSEVTTELITLAQKKISPCNACGYCNSNYSCNIDDDMSLLIESLKNEIPDVIIFGTPVYMGSMTAQAKAFLDRTVVFRRNNFALKNIIGCAVAVGGSRNGGQEITIQSVHAAMLIHGMIVIGDSSPTAHFGGTGWAKVSGGYQNDAEANATYDSLAERITETLNLIKATSDN